MDAREEHEHQRETGHPHKGQRRPIAAEAPSPHANHRRSRVHTAALEGAYLPRFKIKLTSVSRAREKID
jgi:hypothetical protein